MTITPVTATFQLDLEYQVAGETHKLQMRCYGNGTGIGTNNLLQQDLSTISAQDAADQVFTLMAPLYKTADTSFIGWTLQEYSGGAYLPTAQGSTAVVASGAGTTTLASQTTMFFRDRLYKPVKFILLEITSAAFGKYTYASLSAHFQALVDDINDPTNGHIGCWYTGRAGEYPPFQFKDAVISLNRRLRRNRGMA